MKYKNVIWDFDGTLFNSYPAMVESFHLTLKEFNIHEEPAKIESLMKISVSTVINYIQEKYNCSTSFVGRFSEIRKEIESHQCIPYPETYTVCKTIVESGGRNFIFTHRGSSTFNLLKKYKLDSYFTECITKENGFERKPNPDAINYLIKKYELDITNTIMVGDRELDILAGLNAGISTCFYNNEDKPHLSTTTFEIKNLLDLISLGVIRYNQTKEVSHQYSNSNHLQNRIALHQKFSTSKIDWMPWVFQHYQLKSGIRILELGCGNGEVWKQNIGNIPDNLDLILSDFSSAMIDSCKNNLSDLSHISYEIIDVQNIPYPDDSFDIVIANHMLYHVPDIELALKEITRICKSEGIFYATTIGKNNLKELNEFLIGFNSNLDLGRDSISSAFGLENGSNLLLKYFEDIQCEIHDDGLCITDATALIDYYLSFVSLGNLNDYINDNNLDCFQAYIHQLFKDKNSLNVQKENGIFICKKKRASALSQD